MRLGLIGAGRWGKRYIQTICSLPGLTLARVASRNSDSARLVPSDCRISSDWRDVAGASDLDGVVIATPPAFHAEMALYALSRGLGVLVEKPFTLTVEEARTVREMSRRVGRPVLVDHTHLFSEAMREMLRRVPGKGRLLHIESSAGNYGPFRPDVAPLWDWGAHDVAMCLAIAGQNPATICAARKYYGQQDGGIAEDVSLWLTFSEGVTAHIHLSNIRSDKRRYLAVQCVEGVFVYDDLSNNKLVYYSNKSEVEYITLNGYLPLTNAILNFCSLLNGNDKDDENLLLACACVETLTRAESCIKGAL